MTPRYSGHLSASAPGISQNCARRVLASQVCRSHSSDLAESPGICIAFNAELLWSDRSWAGHSGGVIENIPNVVDAVAQRRHLLGSVRCLHFLKPAGEPRLSMHGPLLLTLGSATETGVVGRRAAWTDLVDYAPLGSNSLRCEKSRLSTILP